MTTNPLIGTWQLESFVSRSMDGEKRFPYGVKPSGYLIYGDAGFMLVAIARADRPLFAVPDLLRGSVEERANAAASYISYGGSYQIEGDRVSHQVEISLFPNWLGGSQNRSWRVHGDTLTLTSVAMMLDGKEQRAILTWTRMAPVMVGESLV